MFSNIFGDNGEEEMKDMVKKINKLREDVSKELISDSMLKDFRKIIEKHFGAEDIPVNQDTVIAFRTALELTKSDKIPEDGLSTMIISCDRLIADEKDKDDLSSRIEIAED